MFTVRKAAPVTSQWHLVVSIWLCYDWKKYLDKHYRKGIYRVLLSELISELVEDTACLNGRACPVNSLQEWDKMLILFWVKESPVDCQSILELSINLFPGLRQNRCIDSLWCLRIPALRPELQPGFLGILVSVLFPGLQHVCYLCLCLLAADLENLSTHNHVSEMT